MRIYVAGIYKREYFRGLWFWVDVVAVVPSCILYFFPIIDFPMAILRTLRIFRIFRTKALQEAGEVMLEVAKGSWDEPVATFSIVVCLLLVSSVTMTSLEAGHSKSAFSHPWESMWWAVATVTTVGYGDVVPESIRGKILGGAICLLAVLLFALPTAILGSSFVEIVNKRKKTLPQDLPNCPRCGEPLGRFVNNRTKG